jgi:hypothetical protein
VVPQLESIESPGQTVDHTSPSYSQKIGLPSPPGARTPTAPDGAFGKLEYAAGSPRESVAATQTERLAAAG